jgi:hypothetical protein
MRIAMGYDATEEAEQAEYRAALSEFATRGQAIADARDTAFAQQQVLLLLMHHHHFIASASLLALCTVVASCVYL